MLLFVREADCIRVLVLFVLARLSRIIHLLSLIILSLSMLQDLVVPLRFLIICFSKGCLALWCITWTFSSAIIIHFTRIIIESTTLSVCYETTVIIPVSHKISTIIIHLSIAIERMQYCCAIPIRIYILIVIAIPS